MSIEAGLSKCRPIIVLGAERSGTSVVAEIVYRWGAYAGEPEQLTPADQHNPHGYWEYKPIWDFLADLGDFAAGVTWWDASFQDHVTAKLAIPHWRDRALELVAAMERAGKPWVWKDPALSFFLPFWKEIWGDAAYIIMVRNPYDTARSWQQFTLPSMLEGSGNFMAGNLLRWQYMMVLILEHTEAAERKIFIPYEGLVQEPWEQAKRLAAFLNWHCGVQLPEDTRIEVMAETVDPKLWHNQSQIPFSHVQEATKEQKALHQLLERKVKAPHKKFERAMYPLPPGWREFVKNAEALKRAHSQEEDSANGE